MMFQIDLERCATNDNSIENLAFGQHWLQACLSLEQQLAESMREVAETALSAFLYRQVLLVL